MGYLVINEVVIRELLTDVREAVRSCPEIALRIEGMSSAHAAELLSHQWFVGVDEQAMNPRAADARVKEALSPSL